jgi:hypothetical protein
MVINRVQTCFNDWVPGFPYRVVPRPFFAVIHLLPTQGRAVFEVLLSAVVVAVEVSVAEV